MVVILACGVSLAAGKEGLVLHYTFDEGAGQVVLDRSGHGNDGKIRGTPKWVKEKSFGALHFSGDGDFIECGKRPSLELSKTGTLEMWCLPKETKGGLIAWRLGRDLRLVFGFHAYRNDNRLITALSDGKKRQFLGELMPTGMWTHLVMTFDGANIRVFRNGVLLFEAPQKVVPNTRGAPLCIGYSEGLGEIYFHGKIGEVRIYNRALSREEIAEHHKTGASAMGLQSKAKKKGDLVLHYAFDEGSRGVVGDRSGHGNHGRIFGAQTVKGTFGSALEFDGKDDYVEAPASDSFAAIRSEGTISLWCRPQEKMQGGLAVWDAGGKHQDKRLGLMVMTEYAGNRVWASISNGRRHVVINDSIFPFIRFGHVAPREWVHLAVSFDGKRMSAYRDGLLLGSVTQGYAPEIGNVALWLGRVRGMGAAHFHGLMDEVRVYSRCLSAQEILASYEENAEGRLKDISSLGKARVEVHPYVLPEKLGVNLDVRRMRLPEGTSIRLALGRPGQAKPMQERMLSGVGQAEIIFAVPNLPPGEYVVRVSALSRSGKQIGAASSYSVAWPERPAAFRDVKVLNNLVWELLNVSKEDISTPGEYTFRNPRDGWVHISTHSPPEREYDRVWVMLDSRARKDAVIVHSRYPGDSMEAMRFLPAGEHVIRIEGEGRATLSKLIVRRMPAIYYCNLPDSVVISQFRPYDQYFLWDDVLRNVNVIVHGIHPDDVDLTDFNFIERWKSMGRKYICGRQVKRPKTIDDAGLKEVFDHWTASPGMQNPLFDGIIVDEFGVIDEPYHDLWRRALEKIHADPQFRDKEFIGYTCSHYYDSERRNKFYRTVLDTGGYIAPEIYIVEATPSEEEAEHLIRDNLVATVRSWEKTFPGSTKRMIVAFAYFCTPNCNVNVDPTVNYKVLLDMKFQCLANHPALFGLGGVTGYRFGRCDEETLRWIGRLYRHYAIEGKTERLSESPYTLTHISNPDFAEGDKGWALAPAENGSIATKRIDGYGFLQCRYRVPAGMGDTCLWTKRSAAKPNRVSQQITGLEPGRLYSLKMYTADYGEFIKGKSRPKNDAVSINLENADVVTGPRKNFQANFSNVYPYGAFDYANRFYMNYHWKVFRAKDKTVELTISDWASDAEPGGPIGQELIYNFIEIQPYLGD